MTTDQDKEVTRRLLEFWKDKERQAREMAEKALARLEKLEKDGSDPAG